jgi:hypothetical protein
MIATSTLARPSERLSANVFGWLFINDEPVTAAQQHAFSEMTTDAPSRIGPLSFDRKETDVWVATGQAGVYHLLERGKADGAGTYVEPLLMSRSNNFLRIDEKRLVSGAFTDYCQADETLLYASILNWEAAADGGTLSTMLTAYKLSSAAPSNLAQPSISATDAKGESF